MIYSFDYTPKFHDVDANRLLRPSALFNLFQEAANSHFFSTVCSFEHLRDELGLAFVLSRMAVSVLEPIRLYEPIKVETWTAPSKAYSFNRCFRITRRSDGKRLAEALSIWALLDLREMKMERIDAHDFGFEDEDALTPDAPVRFRMPELSESDRALTRSILYSDIDCNMHMNNAHYPDMFCDLIPEIEKKRVSSITLSWGREAHYGDTVEVYMKKDASGDAYLFRLCGRDGGTRGALVDARIETVEV